MPGEASRANGKKGGRPSRPTAKTLAIQRGKQKALELAEVTSERTMLEIARLAFADRRVVWTEDGKLKPFNEWGPDEAALLEGFEVIIKNAQAGDGHVDTVHKVKLTSKIAALEMLAKHFGLVSDKLKIDGKVTLESLLVASMQRPQE